MGAFEANPVFVEKIDPHLVFGLYDLDWDVYMPYLIKHMEVMPKMAEVGYKTIICGPETFTPDNMPLFGRVADVRCTFLWGLYFIYCCFYLSSYTMFEVFSSAICPHSSDHLHDGMVHAVPFAHLVLM